MLISILTIFPDMFTPVLTESIIKRAQMKGIVTINVHDLRKWTTDNHKTVDDRPFGGGPGMVLKPEPIFLAVEELLKKNQEKPHPSPLLPEEGNPLFFRACPVLRYGEGAGGVKNKITSLETKNAKRETKIILLSPQGPTFNQQTAQDLSQLDHLILICGRYEGVDQRVIDHLIDEQLSIGNYILTGGELPAMVVIDAVTRLLPGALGNPESLTSETFNNPVGATGPVAPTYDFPVYTQPADFRGHQVPEVLRSGNHSQIAAWRQEASRATHTKTKTPSSRAQPRLTWLDPGSMVTCKIVS